MKKILGLTLSVMALLWNAPVLADPDDQQEAVIEEEELEEEQERSVDDTLNQSDQIQYDTGIAFPPGGEEGEGEDDAENDEE